MVQYLPWPRPWVVAVLRPGVRLSGTTRTLASPTLGGATPVTTARGDGGQPQQPPPWGLRSLCEGAHGSGVLFEELCAMLQLPPSRALRQSRKMDWQAPMMPLSCSSNCCDLMPTPASTMPSMR